MSLLTIVQQSCRLLSLPIPDEVVTSQDTQVQQLYALANEEGHELSTSFDWQILTREHTFTTVPDPEQPSAVPSDLQRFIANSFFDRTTRREFIGPITPQVWQAIQAQPQLNRVFLAFRERDNAFLVTPTPSSGDTIAYEYVSKNWAKSIDDEPKDEFTADTDNTYLSERLFVLSLRWKFLSSKGFPYAQAFDSYQRELQKEQAKDGGMTKIDASGRTLFNLFPNNVPAGNWPGPI
jgi:hypothetical protein